MSATETETKPEGVLEKIDKRIAALAAAEKQLKKPSTVSFVERQKLSSQASKAAAELRARRPEAEGLDAPEAEADGGDGAGEEAGEATAPAAPEVPTAVKAALTEADRVLGLIGGAQMGGGNRPGGYAAKVVGQARHTGGMNNQQRPPDRVGGE